MSTSPLAFDALVVNNVVGDRILDVGCGHGKWGYLLKKYADPKKGRRHVVGVDRFEPHVRALRAEGVYDEVHVADAVSLPFADRSFDTAIACELIEHLEPGQGPALIAELARVARACFIVSCPMFPCLREGGDTLDGFNPYEAHRQMYSFREFQRLGFTQIVGVGRLKLRPWKLAVAFSSLGLLVPRLSRYALGFRFADGRKRILATE